MYSIGICQCANSDAAGPEHADIGHTLAADGSSSTATLDARSEQQAPIGDDFTWGNGQNLTPSFFHDEHNFDQAWMRDSSDMTWLSLAPFLEDVRDYGPI